MPMLAVWTIPGLVQVALIVFAVWVAAEIAGVM